MCESRFRSFRAKFGFRAKKLRMTCIQEKKDSEAVGFHFKIKWVDSDSAGIGFEVSRFVFRLEMPGSLVLSILKSQTF